MVVSGAAEAILEDADGSTEVVNTFGPTDFFGELAALERRAQRTADQADTYDCDFLEKHCEITRFFLATANPLTGKCKALRSAVGIVP